MTAALQRKVEAKRIEENNNFYYAKNEDDCCLETHGANPGTCQNLISEPDA